MEQMIFGVMIEVSFCVICLISIQNALKQIADALEYHNEISERLLPDDEEKE